MLLRTTDYQWREFSYLTASASLCAIPLLWQLRPANVRWTAFLIDWKQDANMYIQLRFSQAAIIKPLYPRPNCLQETLNACAWDTPLPVVR